MKKPREGPADGKDDRDEWLTVDEAAAETRMGESSIYDACHKKLLAHYRVSGSGKRGKILIKRGDLAAWIESQRIEAGGAPPAPIAFTHVRP